MTTPTPIELMRAEATHYEEKQNEVFGYWRDHEIWLQRDVQSSLGGWYIQVKHPDGCYLYDGWWRPVHYTSPDEVVAEAFEGACLLEEE